MSKIDSEKLNLHDPKQIFGIDSPDDSAVLWRYFDFPKFASLISEGRLFFARADRFSDEFEGTFSKISLKLFNSMNVLLPDDIGQGMRSYRQKAKESIYINCWHHSDYESESMWRLYGASNDAIAIRTNAGDLFDAVKRNVGMCRTFIASINYIDYEKDLQFDGLPPSRVEPWLYKRKNFEHEREVRIILDDEFGCLQRLVTGADPQFITDRGVDIFIDLRTFIHEIIISPYAAPWTERVVSNILKAFRYPQIPVSKSRMKGSPYTV